MAQPDPSNQLSTNQGTTTQLITKVLQAHKDGTLADVTSQLLGQQAEELDELLALVQAVADSADVERNIPSIEAKLGTDSDSDSPTTSENEMDGADTEASGHDRRPTAGSRRCASPRLSNLLNQQDNDVVFIEEHINTDTIRLTTTWGECVKHAEVDWASRFPPSKPFMKSHVKEVDDRWYQGEDCVDPLGIAPVAKKAILPAADRSLGLVLPMDAQNIKRVTWNAEWSIPRPSVSTTNSSLLVQGNHLPGTSCRKSGSRLILFGKRRYTMLSTLLVPMTPRSTLLFDQGSEATKPSLIG